MQNSKSYLEMAFDRDGYFGSHNRHLFAASMWLQELIESETDWPVAASLLGTYLRDRGGSADHNALQIHRAQELIAPWLSNVTETGHDLDS